jgi:hypothetical protein
VKEEASMSPIRPYSGALLVFDEDDLLLFRSLAAAGLFLEAWQIEEQGMPAYGVDGTLLLIKRFPGVDIDAVKGPQASIETLEEVPRHQDALRAQLIEYLRRWGNQSGKRLVNQSNDPSLEELVRACIEQYGWAG